MRKKAAIEYFGSQSELARALGIKAQAVFQWGEIIPKGRAYEIQAMTKGKLKADFPDLKKAS